MTEFTKTKMHFALAVIGALFGLHTVVLNNELPVLPLSYYDWRDAQFHDWDLRVIHIYGSVMALLALAVYFYAMVLMSERASSLAERAGNYSYALAILLVPLYGGLYLSHVIGTAALGEDWIHSHLGRAAPLPALVVGLVLFLLLARWLRRRLGEKDRAARIKQLERQEIESVRHAREMFGHDHYDLSVVEAWKAVEARLRRVLLQRGTDVRSDKPQRLIDAARRAGLVREATCGLLHDLRHQWAVAVGTEPVTREAADAALHAARHILATVAVEEPNKVAA
jgi:hypothetical protein